MGDTSGSQAAPLMTAAEPEPPAAAPLVPGGAADRRVPPLRLHPPPEWHRPAEAAMKALAWISITGLILVFIFVGREALPLLTNAKIRSEAPVRSLFVPQQWAGYDDP